MLTRVPKRQAAGAKRTRTEPVFPAPEAGQARGRQALPTGPRVTSATGYISTRPAWPAQEGWIEGVLLPLRAWRGIQLVGRGRGLGKEGQQMEREKAAQAKLKPHGQMLAQWRPRPQGCQGSYVLGIHGGGRPELGAEVKTKERQQRGSQSHPVGQQRIEDSLSEALGWSGWGAVCGKQHSANENQAWKLAGYCSAPGRPVAG